MTAAPLSSYAARSWSASDACRACHPGHHASWHESFHRTMTQPATRDNVLGRFDDVWLTTAGAVAEHFAGVE